MRPDRRPHGERAKVAYPQPLRRVKYRDAETNETFDFLTNNFAVQAATVADLNSAGPEPHPVRQNPAFVCAFERRRLTGA